MLRPCEADCPSTSPFHPGAVIPPPATARSASCCPAVESTGASTATPITNAVLQNTRMDPPDTGSFRRLAQVDSGPELDRRAGSHRNKELLQLPNADVAKRERPVVISLEADVPL